MTPERHIAAHTGPHQHRRGLLVHDGVRVGYARCALGTAPTFHCPDGPDPMSLLIRRHAEAIVERVERARRCPNGDHDRVEGRNAQGHSICLTCRREASRRARMRRVADRWCSSASAPSGSGHRSSSGCGRNANPAARASRPQHSGSLASSKHHMAEKT